MTNKQLLKRLQYQQNKLLNIKDYSFDVESNNSKDLGIYFYVYIHDGRKDQKIIFNDSFSITDELLNFKLCRLKDCIDGLLNNQTTRN